MEEIYLAERNVTDMPTIAHENTADFRARMKDLGFVIIESTHPIFSKKHKLF